MEPATRRPTVVTVIGWLFVVYGIIGILGGLVAIGMLFLAKVAAGFPGGMQGQALPLAAMARAPATVVLGAFARMVAGAFVIVTAASLLRLQSWSRVALQVFCGLAMPYTLVSGIIGIRAMPGAMAQTSGAQIPPGFERGFAAIAVGATVLVIIVMVTLYALAIWALGLPAVKQAMAGGRAHAPASPGAPPVANQ
jgi:hypothetical protein